MIKLLFAWVIPEYYFRLWGYRNPPQLLSQVHPCFGLANLFHLPPQTTATAREARLGWGKS